MIGRAEHCKIKGVNIKKKIRKMNSEKTYQTTSEQNVMSAKNSRRIKNLSQRTHLRKFTLGLMLKEKEIQKICSSYSVLLYLSATS